VWLGGIVGLTGFSRTKEEVTFQELKPVDNPLQDTIPPMAPYLEAEWSHLIEELHQENLLLNHEAWRRITPTDRDWETPGK